MALQLYDATELAQDAKVTENQCSQPIVLSSASLDPELDCTRSWWPDPAFQWQGKFISSCQQIHSRDSLEATLKIIA